jgi:hypothetical protein
MDKILCINDKNRPNEIPLSKWIKKGEFYTPIKLLKCNVQGGILGFILAEIDLDASCEPYKCFDVKRFAVPVEDKVLEEQIETELIEI